MKIKNLFFATALIASTAFLQSCLNNDESNVPTFVDWATVEAFNSEGASAALSGDTEGDLLVSNGNILKTYKADSIGQRVFCNFIKNSTQSSADSRHGTSITIYDLYKVLTKKMDMLTPVTEETYGNSPINIIGNTYVSEAHLNIQFQILTGNSEIKHRISLVAEPNAVPDEKGYITVELRHNAESDRAERLSWGLVSYTLESVPGFKEGTLKGFYIKCNTIHEGERIFEVAVKTPKAGVTPMGAFPEIKAK